MEIVGADLSVGELVLRAAQTAFQSARDGLTPHAVDACLIWMRALLDFEFSVYCADEITGVDCRVLAGKGPFGCVLAELAVFAAAPAMIVANVLAREAVAAIADLAVAGVGRDSALRSVGVAGVVGHRRSCCDRAWKWVEPDDVAESSISEIVGKRGCDFDCNEIAARLWSSLGSLNSSPL